MLTRHEAVEAAGVVGVPDDKWGEAVCAVVVVRPGAEVSGEELIALVRSANGQVHLPKHVVFADALPLTALAKPDMAAMRSVLARPSQG